MNFDELIDRNQYPTLKWDRAFLAEHFGNADAIPMAVADMDFKSPPCVNEALQQRVAHGIYGYENRPQSMYLALGDWFKERHGWDIDQQHIEPCPSILSAMAVLINQHSDEGDGVIVQPPVFFEFRGLIRGNQRKMIKNPLILEEGRYRIDFGDLEAKAADPRNKILILCNPHNPVGRVWTADELKQVAELCARHDVFVISDEIHADFAFAPHKYTPYLSVASEGSQKGVAFLSPAKTFNIAGIVDAVCVIPDDTIRAQFSEYLERYLMNKVNVFSSVAVEVAYREGAAWLDAVTDYVKGNVDLIREFLSDHDLGVSMIEPEGTFLVWLDFRELGMDAKELAKFIAADAGVALSPGYWYGREGAGFARMTVGCPRETTQRALNNLAGAINKR